LSLVLPGVFRAPLSRDGADGSTNLSRLRIAARPIGMLEMIDGGDRWRKSCVPQRLRYAPAQSLCGCRPAPPRMKLLSFEPTRIWRNRKFWAGKGLRRLPVGGAASKQVVKKGRLQRQNLNSSRYAYCL